MIKIKPGDVIAFERKGRYYYAVIITKVILFGGNLVHAFHLATDKLLSQEELLLQNPTGFNSIVDFISAKRENRIMKLGTIENILPFRKYKHFKKQSVNKKFWFIEDVQDGQIIELRKTEKLTEEEMGYPYLATIPEGWLVDYIETKWSPEKSPYFKVRTL